METDGILFLVHAFGGRPHRSGVPSVRHKRRGQLVRDCEGHPRATPADGSGKGGECGSFTIDSDDARASQQLHDCFCVATNNDNHPTNSPTKWKRT